MLINDLLAAIKQAAVDAVAADKPMQLTYGQVISAAPLQVQVDQKSLLTIDHLVLTRSVTDYDIDMTVAHQTEPHTHSHSTPQGVTSNETHSHAYVGRKTFRVHGALKVGEHVILLRMQGGQKYIVLDRIGG